MVQQHDPPACGRGRQGAPSQARCAGLSGWLESRPTSSTSPRRPTTSGRASPGRGAGRPGDQPARRDCRGWRTGGCRRRGPARRVRRPSHEARSGLPPGRRCRRAAPGRRSGGPLPRPPSPPQCGPRCGRCHPRRRWRRCARAAWPSTGTAAPAGCARGLLANASGRRRPGGAWRRTIVAAAASRSAATAAPSRRRRRLCRRTGVEGRTGEGPAGASLTG
jgi:hypothetical protein